MSPASSSRAWLTAVTVPLTGEKTSEEAVAEFQGQGYGQLKEAVGEAVVSILKPMQDRMAEIAADKSYLDKVIKENAERAYYSANKTLRKVKKKIGLTEMPR